jgi:hypothetical protein
MDQRQRSRYLTPNLCAASCVEESVFEHDILTVETNWVRLCDFAILTQSPFRYCLTISDANLLTFTLSRTFSRVPLCRRLRAAMMEESQNRKA